MATLYTTQSSAIPEGSNSGILDQKSLSEKSLNEMKEAGKRYMLTLFEPNDPVGSKFLQDIDSIKFEQKINGGSSRNARRRSSRKKSRNPPRGYNKTRSRSQNKY